MLVLLMIEIGIGAQSSIDDDLAWKRIDRTFPNHCVKKKKHKSCNYLRHKGLQDV